MRNPPSGKLDRKVVTSWRIGNVISSVIWGAILIGCAVGATALWRLADPLAPGFLIWISVGLFVLIFILTVIITPTINYARWRYEVTEDEVDIMRGLIVRKRIIIPLVRVQHVDTKQGPILRALGLAAVSIATAAGVHEIPGLALAEADALRDRVAQLARIAQEDV